MSSPTPEELFAEAIAPLDERATLKEKVDAFANKLYLAEILDSALRHASRANPEHATPVNKRAPVLAALMATMQFLIATGVGNKRQPKTLWRLHKALAELDGSGKVSDLFLSAETRRGASRDTKDEQNLKIAAAVATEIAHKDCKLPLDQAAKKVERELDKHRAAQTLGAYSAATIRNWRDKCIGAGDWSPLFRELIELARSKESDPQRRLKRALYTIRQLSP
jgi:hypothetical protein